MAISVDGFGWVSHKKRKGLNPWSEPCVASIDAVGAQRAGELTLGLEPPSSHQRGKTPNTSEPSWIGSLTPSANPKTHAASIDARCKPVRALHPLRLLWPSRSMALDELATRGAKG